MSAELLREAAALMRRNAETAEPGRWKLWGMSVMADPRGTSDVADAIDVAACHTPSTAERLLHTGNARHIASWHPVVALAVADWLDWEADESERFQAQTLAPRQMVPRRALAVARAYLGRDA